MRLSDSADDVRSQLSTTPELQGSSSLSYDVPGPSNGHSTNGNGFLSPSRMNGNGASASYGSSGSGVSQSLSGNGIAAKNGKSPVTPLNLPGTLLYDDMSLDREEFVRLVLQTLRDVGYRQSAEVLELESGYTTEAAEVTAFREYVLNGQWIQAESALMQLAVSDDQDLWDARFLIQEQKYLELLESGQTTPALHVLRNELAPLLTTNPDRLHSLSSLIMCSEPEDLRQRADWDGAAGNSRQLLLSALHRYIPSSILIPQRRFATLLSQARILQRQRCVYHNTPEDYSAFSLYSDHECSRDAFPSCTTTILDAHKDEVWNLAWSHDGSYLASVSKDKSAIIWKLGSDPGEWTPHLFLRDHQYSVGCVAWSADDSILVTSCEQCIKLWNTKTGACIRTLEDHSDTVTALLWVPDGSGFISAAMDRTIIYWDSNGNKRESWSVTPTRITDVAVTPDLKKLVAIGMSHAPSAFESPSQRDSTRSGTGSAGAFPDGGAGANSHRNDFRMIVYDFATKQIESSIRLDGELTSVKISKSSQYALVNKSPDEIHLYDLHMGRMARRFTGQKQGHHVIRSCFGGIDENFVVSGSEDGNVYVWDRDTGSLLEVLSGHGEGSVNSVTWNPRNERMFASCSDDHTIRIWEPYPPDTAFRSSSGSGLEESVSSNSLTSKGKTRQTGDDLATGSASGSTVT